MASRDKCWSLAKICPIRFNSAEYLDKEKSLASAMRINCARLWRCDSGGERRRGQSRSLATTFFEAQLLVMDEACRIRTCLIWDSQSNRPKAIRF